MQSLLNLLGLALLEILAGLPFFFLSSFLLALFGISFEENFLVHLAVTAIPIMLLAGLLAHFWGLWRANWIVRVATAAICVLTPTVVSMPVIMLLFWRI